MGVAARTWLGDPEADRAATAAETRLQELHPDAMQLYDQVVANGADPVEGMRQTSWAFDRPGQSVSIRPALSDGSGTGRKDADVVVGNPHNPGIDEHADGRAGVSPARAGAAVIDGEVLATRTAADTAR